MREVKQLTENKFLNIKEVHDPENHCKGYQFAERRGVDSIAFICYDVSTKQFLVNNEYKPPVNRFIEGAFGGSLDKDKSLIDIVVDEVEEEAGFVDNSVRWNIVNVGKVFVSTQMNQYCYLFLIVVDKSKQVATKPENAIEAMAQTKWRSEKEILDGEDWKAITITYLAEKSDLL